MKKSRTKYLIYLEPWTPGRQVEVNSRRQMKKVLARANPGSEAFRVRLYRSRTTKFAHWNTDGAYSWYVPEKDELLTWLEKGTSNLTTR